jgi:chromosome segregation ATPase
MEDPVNGTRSAVVFDNSSDMSGATGIFWNPLQDDGSADGGKSTYSPPYSRGESLQDRMARMTAGQNYQELEKKLTKAVDSNSLLMGKVEDLKKNCEEYERENQNLKTKLQTETRRLNNEAILQTRQHLTECKKYEREMQRLNEAIRRERELLITERKDHEHEMQVLKDHIKVLAEHYEGQN